MYINDEYFLEDGQIKFACGVGSNSYLNVFRKKK